MPRPEPQPKEYPPKSTCKHCGGTIIWATLPNGERIALDPIRKGMFKLSPDGRGGATAERCGEVPQYILHAAYCEANRKATLYEAIQSSAPPLHLQQGGRR